MCSDRALVARWSRARRVWRIGVCRVVSENSVRQSQIASWQVFMKKMCILLGTTIGSSIGWWAGNKFGFMWAFTLSIVGTGFGMYYGIRFAREYE
ncbi:MAG TPA: hypothetical protein VH277_10980 [Gemmatimonadaceae bacterium]|jgi:hypothetical protein|nr:hypothetical protein [Gemmatimonadaceae bacterium]